MGELLLKKNAAVYTEEDRVILRIDSVDIFFPYAQVFKIAQNIRLACKGAKAMVHESARWDEIAKDDNIEVQDYSATKPGRQIKGKFDWQINMNSELIYLCFGDLKAGMHFSDALKLSEWMRAGGRKAKRWAGDTSAHKNAMGTLTNAEENYRLGIS